jgi:hypothetical protein
MSRVLREADVDTALTRIFTVAFEAGFMGVPTEWDGLGPSDMDTPQARRLALEAGQQVGR